MAASAASGTPTGSTGVRATGLEMGEVCMATGLVWGDGDGLKAVKAAASRLPSPKEAEPREAVGLQSAWMRGSDLRGECCGALC
mmetsp:Transcript_75637/g.124891  ORF Transcript_75637/g.124891 Transcript_75637/m.124891 type:complete len:84 (+) Transcript_75637:588-839(+)